MAAHTPIPDSLSMERYRPPEYRHQGCTQEDRRRRAGAGHESKDERAPCKQCHHAHRNERGLQELRVSEEAGKQGARSQEATPGWPTDVLFAIQRGVSGSNLCVG